MMATLAVGMVMTDMMITSCSKADNPVEELDGAPGNSYIPGAYYDVTVPDSVYVAEVNQPNPNEYLPAPPHVRDVDFIDDKIQWRWGTSQRDIARGPTAMAHMGRTPEVMCKVMAEVMGLTNISKEATPAMERLLHRAYRTGEQATTMAKRKYNRQRPFVLMGEGSAWYAPDAQDNTGSYTSATTAAGWAVGLVFAEMWPPLQNDILRKAFQFGEDRVISGSNFQSDVEGGYLCGAAAIAQAHNNTKLEEDIAAARQEYKMLKRLADSYNPTVGFGVPEGMKILNAPVKAVDPRHEADLKRYEYAKTFRETARGSQAIMDDDDNMVNMANIFGDIIGITINRNSTPAIYNLMEMIRNNNKDVCNQVWFLYFRQRPYVMLHESTPLPAKENIHKDTSSYPSGHASFAWALGLMFTEVAPAYQNKILARAYSFGYSRVIVGFNWPTDVEAGRLLAATIISHLQINSEYRTLIKQAQAEYQKLK